MREIFIDTNVIFDLLLGREPYSKYSYTLFDYAIRNDIVLNTCSFSYPSLYYVLKKKFSHEYIIHDLIWVSTVTKCLPVNENVVKQALESKFHDFEDAIQYFCALQIPKCEVIITRDKRGFRSSTLRVRTPEVFLIEEKIM